jgi:hypothetical protein
MPDRAVPALPGVPAAGHLAGGYWHPGPPETCGKGECRQSDKALDRQSDLSTSHTPRGPGCCRNPKAGPRDPANHNRAVRDRGRCPDPCHRQPRGGTHAR